MKSLSAIFIALNLSGCALHYYDPDTHAEHVWGFGHVVMKTQPAGVQRIAVLREINFAGLGASRNAGSGFFNIGWTSERTIDIIDDNAGLEFVWPRSSFFNVRIGEAFQKPESQPENHNK